MFLKWIVILLISVMIALRKEIAKMFIDLYKRYPQVSECKKWCKTDGLIIDFSEEEKSHCAGKCTKFAYLSPVADFTCKVVCRYADLLLDQDCSNTEFCKYHRDVNSMGVLEAVETRWYKALKGKIFKK